MIGLGCMRLSTEIDRDEARALAVIHAALDAGVTFFDTADAYALDDRDIGHNERLIARALSERPGVRERVLVATKGGLVRPSGEWAPDGRAKHLRAACERSLRALGVDRIALYQLHAPDRDVPIETSVRALAALKEEGKIAAIGLCNVTVDQIERASACAEIFSVQIALGPHAKDGFRSGVPEHCAARGIRLIAHSPLGGPTKHKGLGRNRALAKLAAKHGAAAEEIALAWLDGLLANIVVIAGARRVETAARLGFAAALARALDAEDRALLDEAFPLGAMLRAGRASRRPKSASGEVVVVMGIQASGKSTAVKQWTERGYARLNRDEIGGRMSGLNQILDRRLGEGERRIVADNTYPSRASRNEVIEIAWKHGAHARCVWLDTPLEEAQVNAVVRMHERYGELPDPGMIRSLSKKDPNAFGPMVQYRWLEQMERPAADEGFESVEVIPFVRRWPSEYRRRALILELDGVLRRSRSKKRAPVGADDVLVDPARAEVLRRHAEAWDLIFGLAWLPEIAAKSLTASAAEEALRATEAALGVKLLTLHCPHGPGPAICWCRRPLPGLGVRMIREHGLDPGACLMVGRTPQDRGFAARLGFRYEEAEAFFGRSLDLDGG